ncbi:MULTISPECIES: YihY/virulence factor BrkB family protein [unclassified Sagittula]|jgi:membrane protein|uniref:YihY/virulence factor BrkB family protein n=1 Tax=unclassified Sagittula TaxID=2624628 RepID=UPI0024C39946|nr:YihY/virulence factor BrkB family protein [Sagittula sp. MA-2]WHZ35050.1 YihY/virulence factor BrkB family protein [Sagittula sp. MA-2]
MNRGRSARRPSQIPLRGLLDVGVRVWRVQNDDNLGLLAAGIAFYALLSLFPGITAAVALAGLFTDPSFMVDTSDALADVVPSAAEEIMLGQLREVVTASSSSLGWAVLFSIGLALFSASRATQNFIIGLNVIYGEKERRGFFKLRALNVALTLGLIVWLVVAIGIVAAMPAAAAFISDRTWVTDVILYLRWPVLFIVGAFGIAFVFRVGPSRRYARWRWLTPGALLACALWVIGSIGFSRYVASFGAYNETFGALGGVIVLLTWLWLSAYIVLLGAAVDAELEAQTRHDTTVGPDRPMGQRGAVKADTIGPARGEPQRIPNMR